MKLFSFACFLTFLLIVLPSMVYSQMMRGCSFLGLDFEKCLNVAEHSVNFDSCCMVINRAVEAGFYCACALLASAGPLLAAPLSLQVSNCNISIPPLAQCQAVIPLPLHPPVTDPALPVLPPPENPNLPLPVSTPTSFLFPLPPQPPQPENVWLNSTTGTSVNSTAVQGEPLVINNTATILISYPTECFSSGFKTMNSMQLTLFLVVALYFLMN